MKSFKMDYKTMGVVFAVLVFVGVLVFGFNFLNKGSEDDGKIVIGFCADNLVIERWQKDQEFFVEKAKAQGAEVLVYNANENNETQKKQIRELIDKKVDVIVVVPYDKDGISGVIQEAKKAGIKVIAYDRLINNAQVDLYISFDNVKVGQLMAEALVEVAPKGNYLIINGSPEDNNSSMFHQGYMDVLEPYIESGDIRIVDEIWAEMWREEPAYEVVSEALEKGETINAIIGANDRLAESAIRALAEEGLAGEVYVAGHDADIAGCQRIIEGTQYVTVYKPIHTLSEEAVALAIKLAKGEEISVSETINNGTYEIPYVMLDVIAVTKENMDETVIEDGFHLREEIYRD